MVVRHGKTARLAVAYLLFTVALVMVPKADIPETPFDEASTSTNEMIVEKAASTSEYRESDAVFLSGIVSQPRRIRVCRVLPVYSGQLTDSRRLRDLFCSLLR